MNIADMANTTLNLRSSSSPAWGRRRRGMQLSLLDTPLLNRRQEAQPPRRPDKLMSVEFEVAGLAVEFKAKSLAGILGWLSLDLTIMAVLQELMRPRQFRTWHGRVAGFVPYDFRKPTLRRIANAVWAPDNPNLFTDTAFGVGWSINLAQLPRVMTGVARQATGASYSGPTVGVPK